MDLSIIIPSYNTKDLLNRCLSSIFTSLEKSKLAFEIIVVDNASNDGTRKLLKEKYTRVQSILNKENSGYGKANNQGIRKARGEYVLLLNSDIQVIDAAIVDLWRFAKQNPKSFIGGRLLNEDGSLQTSCGPMYTIPVVFFMLFLKGDRLGITRSSPDNLQKVDWVSGACLIGQKSSFLDIDLFDEGIFMYMEEVEFLFRAYQKRYVTFFYPEARFIHIGAASSENRRTPVVNIYRGLLYFYRKHCGILACTLLRGMLGAKALAAIAVGRMIGRRDITQTYEEALSIL